VDLLDFNSWQVLECQEEEEEGVGLWEGQDFVEVG
jgi:hypothetical protein